MGISIFRQPKERKELADILKRVKRIESQVKGPPSGEILDAIRANNQVMQLMWFYDKAVRDGVTLDEARLDWFRQLPPADGSLRQSQLAVFALLRALDQICRRESIQYWIDFGTLLGAVRHEGFIPWDDDVDVCMMRGDFERFREAIKNDDDFYLSELYLHSPTNSINHICQVKYCADKRMNIPYCLDIFIYDYCDSMKHAVNVTERHRKDYQRIAWEWYRGTGASFPEDLGDFYQGKVREIFEEHLDQVFDEANLSREPKSYMLWALDNFITPFSFQSNGPVEDVFPLVELEFEGVLFYAPKCYHERLMGKYGDYLFVPQDAIAHHHYTIEPSAQKALDYITSSFVD